MSKIRWVADLVASGFILAEYLAASKTGKHPVTGWRELEYDPLVTADDFPNGYGVVIPENVCVIDVDVRKFPEGDDVFHRLFADLGYTREQADAVDTYRVDSSRGGFHLYFRNVHPDMRFHKNLFTGSGDARKEVYPGIDFLSYGRQVAGPGTIHKNGKMYEVANGHPGTLADLPEGCYELFGRKERVPGEGGHEGEYDDSAENQGRYQEWLLKCARPAVSGEQGTSLAISTAHKGRQLGLSEDTTLALMREYYNPVCVPPFSEKELAQKVYTAYNCATRPVGDDNVAHKFTPVEPATQPEGRDILSWADCTEENYRVTQLRNWAYTDKDLRWDYKTRGKISTGLRDTLVNAMNFFRWKQTGEGAANPLWGLLKYNLFTMDVEFARKPFWREYHTDLWDSIEDTLSYKQYLNDGASAFGQDFERWCPPNKLLYEGVRQVSKASSYHPICDPIRNTVWDGIPRVESLLARYLGADDTAYTRAVSSLLLMGMIHRIFWQPNPDDPTEKGCKFDYMVILEGLQGHYKAGKSSLVNALGMGYGVELPTLESGNEKALQEAMRKAWVCEVPEMSHVRKNEIEWVKSFISRKVDTYRPPYGMVALNYPRHCVLIGTINPGEDLEYLADQTGNRRFLPVKTGVFDVEALVQDRMQIYAEAYQMYLAGVPCYIKDPAVIDMFRAEQDARTTQDPWTGYIDAWLRAERTAGRGANEYTREMLLSLALGIPAREVNQSNKTRLSVAMRQLGWTKGTSGRGARDVVYRKELFEDDI